MAATRTAAHRWLPGIATAALLSVVAAAPAPAAAARHSIGASHPPGYKIVHAGPLNAPPGTFDSGGSVACPTGTVVWGGGVVFLGGTTSSLNVNTSQPSGSTGWEARVNNSGTTTDQSFTLEAICGHKPAGYKIATNSALLEASFTLSDGIGCPTGTSVLSGGAQDPDHVPVVQVAGSIDEDASAWHIDVNNLGQSAHQVNGYAICAA